MGKLGSWRNPHGQQHYSDDWLVLRSLRNKKKKKKTFLTPLHLLHSDLLTQCRFGLWIHAAGEKLWAYHMCISRNQDLSVSIFSVFSLLSLQHTQLLVLGWQCSGSMCDSFWDGFLLTTVAQSGYLSYWSLSVSSVWSFSIDLFHQQGISIPHANFFSLYCNILIKLPSLVHASPRR